MRMKSSGIEYERLSSSGSEPETWWIYNWNTLVKSKEGYRVHGWTFSVTSKGAVVFSRRLFTRSWPDEKYLFPRGVPSNTFIGDLNGNPVEFSDKLSLEDQLVLEQVMRRRIAEEK